MRFWDRAPVTRLATVEAMLADELAAMAEGRCRYWTVLEDGDAIGGIDLSNIRDGAAELGFLFRRDVWGRGLAAEAAGAVIAETGMARISARIQGGNVRAARLLDRLGFRLDEKLPNYALADGRRRDCLLYVRRRT